MDMRPLISLLLARFLSIERAGPVPAEFDWSDPFAAWLRWHLNGID